MKMTEHIPIIAVYGTEGGDFLDGPECQDVAHWWHPFSRWWTYIKPLGFEPFRLEDFVWTGALDGLSVRGAWDWIKSKVQGKSLGTMHKEWRAGGEALNDYIGVGLYNADRFSDKFIVVAHSHGGQVALYCAARERYLPILITVSTPNRFDMHAIAALAKTRIGFWLHLYDPDHDRVGQEGALGDGEVSFDRTWKGYADLSVPITGVDHSGLLRDPTAYHYWQDTILPLLADRLDDWRESDLDDPAA